MTISISSRPSSAFARWSRSFSQSSFRPIARTELTTFDSSTKTSTLRVRIGQNAESFGYVSESSSFCRGLAPLPSQHKLISLRIDAHREMWRLIPFRLWLTLQLTAASLHFPPACDNVRYLKAQTRPGPLSFPAAVDADCRSAHDHLTHHLRLLYHLAAEYVAVKPHCTHPVSRPDYILHTLYLHFSNPKHDACTPPILLRFG